MNKLGSQLGTKLKQNDSEHQSETNWSLQEWINYEVQSTTTEEQSCMNQE